ncbi:MAG: type I restriction enzyme HsdR N-terminal domain-containing protein [Bacteroidota bacterium]
MITVNYPEPSFRIKEKNGKNFIFDLIRRQWIVLTDEEWVRQNFINYMVKVLKYPAALIAVEKEIYLGELKKRFDILVYDRNHQPWLLTECKAPGIKLEQPVLDQVLRYGISVPAKFLLVTNGNTVFGWQKEDNKLKMIEVLPAWKA